MRSIVARVVALEVEAWKLSSAVTKLGGYGGAHHRSIWCRDRNGYLHIPCFKPHLCKCELEGEMSRFIKGERKKEKSEAFICYCCTSCNLQYAMKES